MAAEDTRRTRKLLSHLGISKPLTSYRSQNRQRQAERLVGEILKGRRVALVTDAGMPGISDPGFLLVRKAVESGIPVTAVPGVSSLTTALSISGFPADRFVFEGFLPLKKGARRRRLDALADEEKTVVLFESPHRIASTMEMLAEICPDREVVLAREMTKMYEETIRGSVSEVAVKVAEKATRGEYTLVLHGKDS